MNDKCNCKCGFCNKKLEFISEKIIDYKKCNNCKLLINSDDYKLCEICFTNLTQGVH